MSEFKLTELEKGDVVEFPRNNPAWRFGIATGGFGMSLKTLGSKIFGVFGVTREEAIKNYRIYLVRQAKRRERQDKEMKEKGSYTIDFSDTVPSEGYTRRQPCKVVAHVNPKTGEVK